MADKNTTAEFYKDLYQGKSVSQSPVPVENPYDKYREENKNLSYDELQMKMNHLQAQGKSTDSPEYRAIEDSLKDLTQSKPKQFDSMYEEGNLVNGSDKAKAYRDSNPVYTPDADKQKAERKTWTEDDTWQNRIKNGKASDDDMKTAYEAWKKGDYTPGPKTLEYFKLHFEGKDLNIPEQKEPEMVTLETVDGMTEKQQQSLWDKLKGKLTNKDLEEYAKENGISYGTALRYTLASFLAGVANDQSIYTGVKPFSDEETQSPLYKRYRVTSGKVDEENATTRAEQKFLKDADTRKEAAEKRGQIEGTNEGAKETSYAFYKTDNGKTFLDLANLNASINDINDEQKLRTMQKELELQNMSQKDLQKFLSALTINQNYAMGKNSIQLEKDKIKMLGDYFAENPKEIDNFVDFMQKNAEGNLTAAQEVNQWIDTVMKPASAIIEAGTEGVTRGAKGGL